MASRGWLIILLMGVGGLLILGYLTNFVIESSPDLQKMIRFKVALAQNFQEKGVLEVALRKGPGRYSLFLTTLESLPQDQLERLDGEVSEYFLKNFPDRSAAVLDIFYLLPGSLGCQAGTKYREKQVVLSAARLELANQSQRARLKERLEKLSSRLVSLKREGASLQIDVEPPSGRGGDLRRLASQIEAVAREEFRTAPYTTLSVRLVGPSPPVPPSQALPSRAAHPSTTPPSPPAPVPPGGQAGRPVASGGDAGRKCLLEVRFDSAGREIER